MRITLTLDDDLETVLREGARRLNVPFEQAVNDAIRRGLSPGASSGTATAYRVRTFDARLNPEIDPTRLNQLLDDQEVDNFLEGRKSSEPPLSAAGGR